MFEKMTDRDWEIFEQRTQKAVRPLVLEMARIVRGERERKPVIYPTVWDGVTETDIERDGMI